MKIKQTIIWSVMNGKHHCKLTRLERMVMGRMPLIHAIFPGIKYESLSGYAAVMWGYAVPVLKKKFPELDAMSENEVKPRKKVEVHPFLPSDGFEWQHPKWQSKFRKLLASS